MVFSFDQRFCKRLLDLLVSTILLVITSPIMLIAALCIKLYDHGPVFFKQKRLTIGGKEFYVYKFRSMIVDAEKDGVARLATKNDSRITPVGKVIRATRIDELPQLLNIFKGDMSVVGPRPERPEIDERNMRNRSGVCLPSESKGRPYRLRQIYGKYNTTAYDKLKLDLMYIESYSILEDLKLILATFKIVFTKESTEGLEEGQTISLNAKEEEKKDV
mgnify:CR=1 FL=1